MESDAKIPEFDRYILETGESANIDAKAPMYWDNGVNSAGLAKDIAAFANSKDGGVIVIGKSEGKYGEIDLEGLSNEEAGSFETTKVSTWVNNHFSPSINLVCHRYRFENKTFVIITIDEFSDIPHLCTKSFCDPKDSKRHLLREKIIYVRTANAESAPLGKIEELRALIGMATAKRGHEMIALFNSMLKGNPLVPSKSHESLYDNEFDLIANDIADLNNSLQRGTWLLRLRPIEFNANRFEDDSEMLKEQVRKSQVQLRSEFPPLRTGTHMRDWGICNDTYREKWGLSSSGQFVLLRPYYENDLVYECPWRDLDGQPIEPRLKPGKWIDIKQSLLTIAEFFDFSQRFVGSYGVGERVHFDMRAEGLRGRCLVTTDGNINRDMTQACRANRFAFIRTLSAEEFQATWEELAAIAMKRFSDTFPDTSTSLETMQHWVKRFRHRQF